MGPPGGGLAPDGFKTAFSSPPRSRTNRRPARGPMEALAVRLCSSVTADGSDLCRLDRCGFFRALGADPPVSPCLAGPGPASVRGTARGGELLRSQGGPPDGVRAAGRPAAPRAGVYPPDGRYLAGAMGSATRAPGAGPGVAVRRLR